MLASAKQLYKTRDLLRSWTERTIRARYQQSVLGGLWIIIQPLATVIMFSVIFTYFVPIDTGDIPYPVFSYVALIPWILFASSLGEMSGSLVANMGLITKIYFPREMLPISAMFARMADFFVSAGLLIFLIIIYDVPIFPLGWLFLPVILVIQLGLITGIGLILAATNVFYRDVGTLLALVIQLWFYASPIIYPVSMVPEQLLPFYYLNPMAGILEAYRAVILYQTIPSFSLVISAVIAIIVFIVGFWTFRRLEPKFADVI